MAHDLERYEAPGINTLYRGQPSVVWHRAVGSNVWDVDGNRYVDLTAGFGVATVGHRHPAVVAAMERQSHQLVHGLGDVHPHPGRIDLARRLTQLAPVDAPLVYFAVSGSDAVEIALKTAILATGREHIVVFEPAYHGLTLGALAVTSRSRFRAPFHQHLHPHVHRLPFGGSPGALDDLLAALPVAAVLVEPFIGREGTQPAPPGWLAAVASTTRRHSAVFIADEIYTGFGRTGRRFAVDHEAYPEADVEGQSETSTLRPDLLCCGKALGGGLPIAAVVGRRDLLEAWPNDGEALHTGTFVAHPLACAAALAALEVIEGEELAQRAARLGHWVHDLVEPWRRGTSALPGLVDVRGRGLLWGFEVDTAQRAAAWAQRALAAGLLLLAGGTQGCVLQLAPPLTIHREQLTDALERLRATFPTDLNR